MSRPVIDPDAIASGNEGWDALLRDMVKAIVTTPLPVPQFASLVNLPAANLYDRCLACTVDTNKLYWSRAGSWHEVTIP